MCTLASFPIRMEARKSGATMRGSNPARWGCPALVTYRRRFLPLVRDEDGFRFFS